MDNGLQRYNQFLAKVQQTPKRILVVGDRIRDTYVECRMSKLAPEGGAPVLDVERTYTVPGGAANVAEQLLAWNVPIAGIYSANEHSKHRYLVNGVLHSVVSREGSRLPIPDSFLHGYTPDAIIVADYGKGAINQDVVRLIGAFSATGIPIIVDPSPSPSPIERLWCGTGTIIKMNREQWRRRMIANPREWIESNRLHGIVITNGANQPSVYDSPFARDCFPDRGLPKPIVDCAGAGDHFSAVLAVGIVHGLPITEAAEFAHEASKLRVAYRRPRPIMPAEVRGVFDQPLGKILTAEEVSKVVPPADRIVFTNGVFSCGMHAGHASLFDFAKKQGDVLVVGVNSDKSAQALKGKPTLMPEDQRARIVASHQAVDFVIVFDELTPEPTMEKLPAIDTLVKGSDYEGKEIPGCNLARQVLFAPHLYAEHCSDWFSRSAT